jgi:hypothetical protein
MGAKLFQASKGIGIHNSNRYSFDTFRQYRISHSAHSGLQDWIAWTSGSIPETNRSYINLGVSTNKLLIYLLHGFCKTLSSGDWDDS